MKRTCLRQILMAASFLLFWTLFPLSMTAQGEVATDITIVHNDAMVDFPNEVTFRLELPAATTIAKAELAFDVDQASCLEAATNVPVEVTGSVLEWTWVMIRSGNPPPGTNLWWEWRLTDSAGQEFTTPRQTLAFSDDRFEWRTVAEGGVILHWYRGNEVGPTLLDAAVTGLERLQTEMGIELQDQVQLFIYGSAADMREAVLYISNWAGGVAFAEYGVILIGVPPDIAEDWGRRTVRHELAHLVVDQFGDNCVGGRRPTWLEEGLAVFAEGDLQEDFAKALDSARENDGFEPIRSLSGAFPADETAAVSAYAQSYSVVDFMLTEYGEEKMQALLLTLAQGVGYDEALQKVYGFNVDGLEVAWRMAIGAPARIILPTPTPIIAANVPTIVPLGMPGNVPTPPAAAAPPPEIESPSPGICGLGMVPLLLLGLIRSTRRKRISQDDE